MQSYMDEFIKNTDLSQNKPMNEVIYESLRNTIISGKIPAGERIIEKEYAEKLNISRTPIREALKRLEIEELVEYIPRFGVVVKRISKEDVIEVYKIRHSLEVLATINAMQNISLKEIKEIEDLLSLTEKKNKDGSTEEVIELFGKFNSKIYQISKMQKLASMITKLNEYIHRFRSISIMDNERRERALIEHRNIFQAIVNKDEKQIDIIIKNHLEYSLNIVMQEFND